jgi:hypothetical protein
MIIEPFIKGYLLLALRIDKIFDGYIDIYYGPPELKKLVENESKKSAKELLNNTRELQKRLTHEINNSARQKYLESILNSMEVFLSVLDGKDIDFIDQVEAILGIKPEVFQDKEFYELQEQYNEVYPGNGTLGERIETINNHRQIPRSEIIPKFNKALEITRNRTKELFPNLIPESESINVQFAEERVSWGMYNYYQGKYHSLIMINPFQTWYWTSFLPFAAHEGYPGHHTELSVKNDLLLNQLNWSEHCILIFNTPVGIMTEGIAETALYTLFPAEEKILIELEEFCINRDKEASVEILIKQFELKYRVRKFIHHLTNLGNIEGWSESDLFDYGMEFGFLPEENLRSAISYILSPKFRIYSYTFTSGRDLIAKKFGIPPKLEDFRNLLSKPVLPSDLI